MAKYTVTRACGHTETVALFGKIKDREWRLENVESQKLCTECYQQELARQREEENLQAAEAAKEMELPELTGSEKQIAWAETIRQKMIADIERFVYTKVPAEKRNDPRLIQALESIKNKTEAKWWIDHRGEVDSYEIVNLINIEAKSIKENEMQPTKEVVADAKTEATVRPENPKTETVAEIRVLEDAVEIDFPERRDDFWEIVKKQLRMEWASKHWRRKLIPRNGTPADRAAEAGHRLLAAGFSIRIFDESVRAKAISGDYKPECTNWILASIKGEHEGWFAIIWDRQDDFYKASRLLRGSRYDKPYVVVPPEQFEEVLDFAQMYGFKLGRKAQEIADAARKIKENSLIARVEPPAERECVVAIGRPPILEVPAGVDIDDEFKEEPK